MIKAIHPKWDNCIDEDTTKLIIGTMPPQFVIDKDFDKCKFYYFYASNKNHFWDICKEINPDVKLETDQDCQKFLRDNHIGIIDVYDVAMRLNNDTTDKNLDGIKYNEDIIKYLKKYPNITKLYCTNGDNKGTKDILLNILLKDYLVDFKYKKRVKREFIKLKGIDREIEVLWLYSPSGLYYNIHHNTINFKEIYNDLFSVNK